MNIQEIYADKKRVLDNGYMEWYHLIKDSIENDDDYTLADDELDELIVDLMVSNVLGEITTFDKVKNEDYEMLARENKAMASVLSKLGYTKEQISDIANGAI